MRLLSLPFPDEDVDRFLLIPLTLPFLPSLLHLVRFKLRDPEWIISMEEQGTVIGDIHGRRVEGVGIAPLLDDVLFQRLHRFLWAAQSLPKVLRILLTHIYLYLLLLGQLLSGS